MYFYVYIPQSGSSGALLFSHRKTKQAFVVIAGLRNHIWTDTVVDFNRKGSESANLEDIRKSYYRGNGRGGMLWRNLDRTSRYLTADTVILVDARLKGLQRPRIIDGSQSGVAPAVLHSRTAQYTFTAFFDKAVNGGFFLHTQAILGTHGATIS